MQDTDSVGIDPILRPSKDDFHKEIDLLQACIARMARNSFLLKAWTVSLFAAGIALTKDITFSSNQLLLFVVPLVLFWYLDGFFLDAETRFRKIYEWIIQARPQGDWSSLFALNPRIHPVLQDFRGSASRQMRSKTLRAFYGVPALLLIALACASPVASRPAPSPVVRGCFSHLHPSHTKCHSVPTHSADSSPPVTENAAHPEAAGRLPRAGNQKSQ